MLAAFVAVAALVSGLVFPPGLRAAEKVICPAGTTIETSRHSLDVLRRSSTAESYSQYCTSSSKLVDVTTRWFFLIGGALVLCGLCLLLRSRLTPPLLRAPEV